MKSLFICMAGGTTLTLTICGQSFIIGLIGAIGGITANYIIKFVERLIEKRKNNIEYRDMK